MINSAPGRFIALVLVTVLVITVATPARADADPLTIIAIVGAGLAVVVLIVYLVVAGTEGSKRADEGQGIWFACAGDECAPIPATAVNSLAPLEIAPVERQGP